jgi:hypothetical protein
MPMMWLRAHAQAMPELQGEEYFQGAEVFAVGSGKLKKSDRDRTIRRWKSALDGEERHVLRGNRAGLAMLASLGIKVREDESR